MEQITTEDGVSVGKGDVVFAYYEPDWALIVSDPDPDGWVSVQTLGGRRCTFDGSRLASRLMGPMAAGVQQVKPTRADFD